MSKLSKDKLNRRDFLATSTVAVAGVATCFSMGAKEAIASQSDWKDGSHR